MSSAREAKAVLLREDSLGATDMFLGDHEVFLACRKKEILVAQAMAGPIAAKDVVVKFLKTKIRNLESKIANTQGINPSVKSQLEETLELTKLALHMTRNPSKY